MKCVQGKQGDKSILGPLVGTMSMAAQPLVVGMHSAESLATTIDENTRTSTMQKSDDGLAMRSHADWLGGVGPKGSRINFCKVDWQQAVAGSLLEEHQEQARISWAKFKLGESSTVHGVVHDNQGQGQCYQVRVGVNGDLNEFMEGDEVLIARSAKTDNPGLTVSDMETVKVTPDVTAFLNVENDAYNKARSHVEAPCEYRPSGAIRQHDTENPLNTRVLAKALKSTA